MLATEGARLKKGDTILLNDRSRDWTRGIPFTVSEVHDWGVRCYAQEPEGDSWWNAPWEEIAGRTGEQAAIVGAARPFVYPD